jgi:signal transduction histidine kinase
MKAMFAQIRWRLVAWTMAVLIIILVVLGTAVYIALSRTLLEQVDRNLASRSEQAIPIFEAMGRGGPPDREGYRGGVFYVALDLQGRVIANPQRVSLLDVRLPVPTEPGNAVFGTVHLDGEPTRVYVRPIGSRTRLAGLLVVGQSLVQEENALNSLLLVLVGGGVGGVLLSLAGAWFLSGRALIPIEQAFRRQQEFVADASHELRTPLTVLHAATDVLNRHRAEPLEANGELFDDIRADLVRLERLAGDLLTLARSDRGELQIAVAPLDLGVFVAEVVRRTGPLAREGQVRLSHQQDGAAPVTEADPDRLQQVLLILLDNAIKHTPAGGQVTVQVRQQGADACIEVTDTGAGIAPEHLPRVFDRFYRVDQARSRSGDGSGLGLSIAKMLVEAHGGTLTLSSTLGVGTRAVIRLPATTSAPRSGRLGTLASRNPASLLPARWPARGRARRVLQRRAP